MHEYPLTQRIVEIASERCGDGDTVVEITLVIGEAAGILGESIAMYFDIIADKTPCEGAKLDIVYIKPRLRCLECGCLFERKPFDFSCECGGTGEPTDIGHEFYVKDVIVCRKK